MDDEKRHERHAWLRLLRATALCRSCEEPCFDTEPEVVEAFYREHYVHNVREAT